jgi:subtilisin
MFAFYTPELTKAQNKNSYLVGFNDVANKKLINKHGGKIKKEFTLFPIVSAELTDEQAKKLSKNPNISYVEENAKIYAMGQEIPWGIPHTNTDDVNHIGGTGSNIKIGVIDSGIDYNHEDLNIVGGKTFIDGTTSYMDDYGHGTHVAGIISALNNDFGTLGLAFDAEIYAIKVIDKNGYGRYDDLIEGIEWAILNDIDIINMSLGSNSDSQALENSINKAYNSGILIIAAAGNSGFNKKGNITYPAKYNSVMAVGAIDQNNSRADFSSVGRELELVAPGLGIKSTLPGGYGLNNGTSMAAAHVSGIAALIMQLKPELSNVQIREILNQTATPLGESFSFGYGLINALNAINYTNNENIENNTKGNKKN